MASSSNGQSNGIQVIVVGVIFTVISALLVGLRLFTRIIILRSPGVDDLLMSLAFATSVTLTALTIKQVQFGLGRHITSLTPTELTTNLRTLWIAIIVYYISLALVKTSIIFQYLRIFVNKRTRVACWVLLGIVGTYSITTIFGAVFSCHPISYFWDKSYTGPSSCLDQKALWFSNASLNIVTDLAILICPMPALIALQLPRAQKLGIMIVFAIGGVTCIVSVLRLHSLYIISVSTDPTWDNVGAATWSMVELNIGIACACLPTLNALASRFFPRLLGSTMSGSTRDRGRNTIGGSSYQKSKGPNSKAACSSVYMSGMDKTREGKAYGKDIEVTTVVEVAHQADDDDYRTSDAGANTSQRELVITDRV